MSMKWEHRQVRTKVETNDDGPRQHDLPRQFWARVMNYDTTDDYGTKFKHGCFSESLERRLPRLMYGHGGWENPIALLGRGIDYREQRDGLDVLFEFDDFDFVPMARQIAYQMSNDPTHPTLDQFSVGFIRQRDARSGDGKPEITKARLGEISVVVEGSVPDTRLLSFRDSRGVTISGQITAEDVVKLLARFSLGEVDLGQALEEVRLLAVADGVIDGEEPEEPEETPDLEEETPAEDDEPTPEDGGDGPPADAPPEEAAETPLEEEEIDLSDLDVILMDAGVRHPIVEERGDKAGHKFHGNQHGGRLATSGDAMKAAGVTQGKLGAGGTTQAPGGGDDTSHGGSAPLKDKQAPVAGTLMDELKPSGVPKGKGTYTQFGHVGEGPHTSAAAARRVEMPMGHMSSRPTPGTAGTFILGQRGTGHVFEGNGRMADVAGMAESVHGKGDWIMFP